MKRHWLPQGFEPDENEEDIWIILRRTPICTPPKNNIHTPISRALRPTFWDHLRHCGKGGFLELRKNRREKLVQFFDDLREAAWRFREPRPL
jgi:hypothetical protein